MELKRQVLSGGHGVLIPWPSQHLSILSSGCTPSLTKDFSPPRECRWCCHQASAEWVSPPCRLTNQMSKECWKIMLHSQKMSYILQNTVSAWIIDCLEIQKLNLKLNMLGHPVQSMPPTARQCCCIPLLEKNGVNFQCQWKREGRKEGKKRDSSWLPATYTVSIYRVFDMTKEIISDGADKAYGLTDHDIIS